MDELLTTKELAEKLKRDVSYIYAMKRQGFVMVSNRSTLAAAITWLLRHPAPRATPRKSAARHA